MANFPLHGPIPGLIRAELAMANSWRHPVPQTDRFVARLCARGRLRLDAEKRQRLRARLAEQWSKTRNPRLTPGGFWFLTWQISDHHL